MDEVWEDLTPSSVHHPAITGSSVSEFHQMGLSFQSFISKSNSPAKDMPCHYHCLTSEDSYRASLLGSPSATSSPRTTIEFPVMKNRVLEIDDITKEKKQRLIKSRDASDRCRGRKQAYTKELEIKLQLLRKENAELKRKLQKKPILLPLKVKLLRTLSAPF